MTSAALTPSTVIDIFSKSRNAVRFLWQHRFMLDVPDFSRQQSIVATQLLEDYEDLARSFKALAVRYPKSDVLWQPQASMAWVPKPGLSATADERDAYEMEMAAHKAFLSYGAALTKAATEFAWPSRTLDTLRTTQCPLDENYKQHRSLLVQIRDSRPWRNLKRKCEALARRSEQDRADF